MLKRAKINPWPIAELEEFFRDAKLPEGPINLPDTTMRIINVPLFVKSHLSTIKKHNGNPTYLPYYERLVKFKELIQKQK
jgi:hypothetical protein